jgi:hypothetical protein
MLEILLLPTAARPESFFWGVVVPAAIFLFSFVVTWVLYKRFSEKP